MITKTELKRAVKSGKGFVKGQIESPKSSYQPSNEAKKRIKEVLERFSRSVQIMTKPYEEFNNQSLIDISNECQKLWNNWRDAKSTDADDAWKSNAVRPIVRNRAVSIAAHVTGTIVTPNIQAQNDQQQEDKDAATVMRDLMEWANEQSEYVKTFLYAVIGALVNPATIVYTEFAEQYRTVREDGKTKQVLDDVMSGFRDTIVPTDELYLADIYEHNIQKQPFLIWRRAITWEQALAKYGDNTDFLDYVKPGLQVMFDEPSDSFYEQHDENLADYLVEEVIYFDRFQDLQLTLVNGVLLSEPDKANPRKDKLYPFAKSGYELIDEGKFFYYFSLVRKMKDDAEIINTLYNMIIDGSFLQLMPPTAIFGNEEVNSSVVTPGTVTVFGENTKLQKIDVGNNLNAGFAAIEKMEASVSESSSDVLQSGQAEKGSQTAFEISRLEQNARVMLGLFGKMIADLVKQWGTLRMGDILQHMTVGEIDEIVGDGASLKYRSFLVPNKTETGQSVNHRVMFGDFNEMAQKSETDRGFDIMAMQGGANLEELPNMAPEKREEMITKGFDSKTSIFLVNPEVFRNLKYKVVVRPDMVIPPSDAMKKALNIELYDRAIANPLANQDAIFKDFLLSNYDGAKDNVDKYVTQQQAPMPQQGGSVLNKLFGQGGQGKLNQAAEQPQRSLPTR